MVRVPPEFEAPATAVAKAAVPPAALAVFPLTVLFVSVTTLAGAELRMPPNASLGELPLFPLTVLFVTVTLLPQHALRIPPTAVSNGAVALALFPLTVLLVRATLPPCWLR